MAFARIQQKGSPQVVLKRQILFVRIVSSLQNVIFATFLSYFASPCEYTTALLRLSITIKLCT